MHFDTFCVCVNDGCTYKPEYSPGCLEFACSGAALQYQFTNGCISLLILQMGTCACHGNVIPGSQELLERGTIIYLYFTNTMHIKSIILCLY